MTTDQTNANTNAHSPGNTTVPTTQPNPWPNAPAPNPDAGVVESHGRTNALKNAKSA